MKNNTKRALFLCCIFFGSIGLQIQAQESVHSSGVEATGSGGTVSATIGQVNYQYVSGSNGSASQGVQQAFEIWVTSVTDIPGITLNVKAYPNPTTGSLWLSIEDIENKNLSYQVYDFNGKLLITEYVSQNDMRISLEDYSRATYFIRIMSNEMEIKTFKIIKN